MSCPDKYRCASPVIRPCAVTWEISPTNEVPVDGEITLNMRGLAGNVASGIRVVLPNGENYIWHVKSDASGYVSEKLKLTSGKGQYCFIPCVPCCDALPQCYCIEVTNCVIPAAKICDVKFTSKQKALVGNKILLTATNLLPSSFATVQITNVNTQVTTYFNVAVSANGDALFEHTHTVPVETKYTATITDGTCTSTPIAFEYVNPENTIPTLPLVQITCDEAIHATARFDKSRYSPGSGGNLMITICNRSNAPRVISYVANLALTPGVVFNSTPALTNIAIPADTCVDYPFFFGVAANATSATNTVSFTGNYMCAGREYKLQTNSPSFDVVALESTCGLQVLSWAFSSGSWKVNTTGLKLTLLVKNTGTAPQSAVQLLAGILPPGLNSTPIGFSNVNIVPGATYTYTVNITPSQVGSYAISLDSGDVIGNCKNSTSIAGNLPITALLTVVP